MERKTRPAINTALLASLILAGCASPLDYRSDREMQRAILESARRELADARLSPTPVPLTRESRVEDLELREDILQQLEEMAGPMFHDTVEVDLGPNLLGRDQESLAVSLEESVATGIEHNLNVQFARLAPAISQSQIVAAESAFDWVFFSNFDWNKTDQGSTSPSIGGAQVGVQENETQVVTGNVGIRKPLISGGLVTIQHGLTYTDVESSNLFTTPDPAKEGNITVQLDQPLLRNFGSEVSLAQVRLARNTERDDIQNLRAQLIQTVTDIETAYWGLYLAYRDLVILQELLDRGQKVLDKMNARRNFDVTPAERADAVARVEDRRGDVMRAQKALRDASDQLKLLLNDPRASIGSEILLLPSDALVDEPIEFSLYDAILTSIEQRPEIQRAIISLDNTSIRQDVADNQRLPQLDLRAQIRFSSLSGEVSRAYRDLTTSEFIDYFISLAFEQPIGNRGPESQFRQRRLERMQATIAYRNTVTGVIGEIKASLRNVDESYKLIEQTRTFRIAAAENLRTLELEEEFIEASSPALLNLKLNRQEALAAAEQQEYRALVDYNVSLAELHAAMGTALTRNRIAFDVPDVKRPETDLPFFPTYRDVRERPASDPIGG